MYEFQRPSHNQFTKHCIVIFCCLDWYFELSGWESNVVTKSDGLCGIQHYQHYTVSVIIKDFELTELLIHVPSRYVLSISSHLKLSVHCDVKRLTSPSLKLRCEDIYNGTLIALLSVLLPSSDNTYHDAHCTRLLCSNLWKKVFLFNIRISIKMLQFEFLIEVFKLEPRFVRNVIFKFLHIIIFFLTLVIVVYRRRSVRQTAGKKRRWKMSGLQIFVVSHSFVSYFPQKENSWK